MSGHIIFRFDIFNELIPDLFGEGEKTWFVFWCVPWNPDTRYLHIHGRSTVSFPSNTWIIFDIYHSKDWSFYTWKWFTGWNFFSHSIRNRKNVPQKPFPSTKAPKNFFRVNSFRVPYSEAVMAITFNLDQLVDTLTVTKAQYKASNSTVAICISAKR